MNELTNEELEQISGGVQPVWENIQQSQNLRDLFQVYVNKNPSVLDEQKIEITYDIEQKKAA